MFRFKGDTFLSPMRIFYIVLFFIFLVRFELTAKEPVVYIGIEQGLSNNFITDIFQDSHGVMWFGTIDGLNRYDGYKFTTYKNQPDNSHSLIDNRVTDIGEDYRGYLWVATKKGVSMMNTKGSEFHSLEYTDINRLNTKVESVINGLAFDPKGNRFFAGDGTGLLMVPHSSEAFSRAYQVPLFKDNHRVLDYNVQAIDCDKEGTIWLIVHGVGLCFYDEKANVVRLHSDQFKSVKNLKTDQLGNIWMGTDWGLYKYDFKRDTFQHLTDQNGLSSNLVSSLNFDKNNRLWIGTDGGGINVLDTQTGKFIYYTGREKGGTLTSSAIFATYEDAESRQWIGTLRGGVNVIDPNKGRFKLVQQSNQQGVMDANDFILSFMEDKNKNVWIGTDGEGITVWDRLKNRFSSYKHQAGNPSSLSNNYVTNILQDSKEQIWIATYGGGINRFDKDKGEFKRYICFNTTTNYENRNVWKLYEDRKGNIWATTLSNGGLYKLDRQKDEFVLFDASITNVLSIYEDKRGIFWFGTYSDLIKYNENKQTKTHISIGNAVRFIHQGQQDSLWLGTEGGGLLHIDKNSGKFNRFTETDGLPSNAVLNLLEDGKGNYWMSTFNGLTKFDPENQKTRNFYESDGLQSNQFNYNASIKLSSGEFLFGGIKGFNAFFPDSINLEFKMPKLILTDLRVNNKSYEYFEGIAKDENLFTLEKLKIPYNEAVLSIGFAALEYSSPDKIQYAYYLEGWDKGWNYIGSQHIANYSKLSEGSYTLRIKSTNANGDWNTAEKVISIEILPPWWRTSWAYLACFLIVGSGLYMYVYYDRRQTKLKYEVEFARMEVTKEKELNEKKISFFTHIAHEFRTPITLIVNPVKELLYSENKQVESGELVIVYRNARRLLSLVDQLLLFRKADSETDKLKLVKLNIVSVCYEVFLCFKQHAESQELNFKFECEEESVELYADREKIEIAFFNLISNAIKFTPKGGSVIVKIKQEEEKIGVTVSDTGCGIPEHVGDDLFAKFYRDFNNNKQGVEGFGIGLFLVKKFTELHKGSISYTTNKEEGTSFLLTLQKGKKHFHDQYVFEEMGERSVFLEELIEGESKEIAKKNVQKDIKKVTEIISDLPIIIVIDDNEEIRQYINGIFSDTFVVYESESAEEGLDLIKLYEPDIILSDVVMKGTSGIDLCVQVKEDASLSHIPVILLTASSSDEVKLKGIESGADDYITKPFDKDILIARVSNILKSRNQMQQYFYNEITLQSNDFKIAAEYSDFLSECILIVEQHLEEADFNVKSLADEMGMSQSALYKRIKSVSGKSPNEFIRFIRLRKVAQLLISTNQNISQAAFSAGFNDLKYFREQFFKLFGMNPSQYKKKYKDNFQKNYNMNIK